MTATPGYYDTSYPPSILGGGPPVPVEVIADAVSLRANGGPVEQETMLANPGRTSYAHLVGLIWLTGLAAAGAQAEDVSLVQPDFYGPGLDDTAMVGVNGDDIVLNYGTQDGGFPLPAGYTGNAVNRWTIRNGAAVTPGEYPAHVEIQNVENGSLVAETDYTFTVQAMPE